MERRKQKSKEGARWLDQIHTKASLPRQSYSPPNMNEAEIMKFINKEAAKQRRAKVNRMAGVAFGQQALRSYTASKKNLLDPDGIGSFHRKQSTFNSSVGRVPRSKQKVAQWL